MEVNSYQLSLEKAKDLLGPAYDNISDEQIYEMIETLSLMAKELMITD